MGQIADGFATTFRPFVTDGVPASGANKPSKAEATALGKTIETAIGAFAAGLKPYATKALLDADTAQPLGTLAHVYDDATPANNGVYHYETGGWVVDDAYYEGVASVVQPIVDDGIAQVDLAVANVGAIVEPLQVFFETTTQVYGASVTSGTALLANTVAFNGDPAGQNIGEAGALSQFKAHIATAGTGILRVVIATQVSGSVTIHSKFTLNTTDAVEGAGTGAKTWLRAAIEAAAGGPVQMPSGSTVGIYIVAGGAQVSQTDGGAGLWFSAGDPTVGSTISYSSASSTIQLAFSVDRKKAAVSIDDTDTDLNALLVNIGTVLSTKTVPYGSAPVVGAALDPTTAAFDFGASYTLVEGGLLSTVSAYVTAVNSGQFLVMVASRTGSALTVTRKVALNVANSIEGGSGAGLRHWTQTAIEAAAGGTVPLTTGDNLGIYLPAGGATIAYGANGTVLFRAGEPDTNVSYNYDTAGGRAIQFAFDVASPAIGSAGLDNDASESLLLAKRSSQGFSAPRKLNWSSISRNILYGDSRSSTDYAWYKQYMDTLTGSTFYNGGFSGHTVAQNASNTELQRIFDYDPQGFIVILPGGNDDGHAGSVGTFSGLVAGEPVIAPTNIASDYSGTYFIQAVDHAVRKIVAHYEDIRARADLTGSETEAQKNTKIRAVTKPFLILCTDLPQQRIDGSNSFSQPENWERKRAAIIEVGIRNKVHTVDTMQAMMLDMATEPFWPGTTDMATNYGVLTMDGLHLNEFGCERLAQIVVGSST